MHSVWVCFCGRCPHRESWCDAYHVSQIFLFGSTGFDVLSDRDIHIRHDGGRIAARRIFSISTPTVLRVAWEEHIHNSLASLVHSVASDVRPGCPHGRAVTLQGFAFARTRRPVAARIIKPLVRTYATISQFGCGPSRKYSDSSGMTPSVYRLSSHNSRQCVLTGKPRSLSLSFGARMSRMK